LLQFMYVAKTCKIGMEMAYPSLIGGKIQAYVVRERQFPVARVPGADAREFLPIGFDAAAAFSNFGNISIVFGHLDTERNKDFKAGVRPYCGSINVNVGQIDDPGAPSSGANAIQALYFQLIKEMWQNSVITDHAECTVRRVVQDGLDPNCPHKPGTDFASSQVQLYQTYLKDNLGPLIDRQIANTDWSVQDPILRLGWAGSSVWYNRIADINGEVTTAVLNIPQGSRFPELMELVAEKKKMQNENINPATLYNPILGDGQPLDLQNAVDLQVATAMYSAYSFWSKDQIAATHFTSRDSNILVSFINKVFGTSGIYDMLENQSIHPMAQLSSLGRAMTEASIRNIFFGSLGNMLTDEKTIAAASSLLNAIGFAFLGIGLILYYILPLLPFIYFIFAVSGWVKGVFEAIIAMPLWALAHILRIDGRGLPGPAATSGYFLLLEIFLRPTLIVIGMIASISIFSSMVVMLNDVFQIAVVNLGGFNRENPAATMLDNFRGPIDQFFYTIMYVIAVYMLALSSFKLIDQIPNSIMRWMGAGVSSFQEKNKNAADELVGRAHSAYQLASGQIRGGNLALLLR
jgi:conjugal transfer/type IV secretion protein DotA/TraY